MERMTKNNEKVFVCISPSKDFGKRDIIILSGNGAKSVGSVTDLANKLINAYKIPQKK